MEPIRDPEVLKRMTLAFDLYEAAEEIMRQNLRRRNPKTSEREIEEGIREWLRRRPGAEYGDGVGRPGRQFEVADCSASAQR
jgi:Rv0078B-related antitoxin